MRVHRISRDETASACMCAAGSSGGVGSPTVLAKPVVRASALPSLKVRNRRRHRRWPRRRLAASAHVPGDSASIPQSMKEDQ